MGLEVQNKVRPTGNIENDKISITNTYVIFFFVL